MLSSAQLFFSLLLFLSSLGEASLYVNPKARHSFSLTTFDSTGGLPQVEYAVKAASMGPPVVAITLESGETLIASPQVLPSAWTRCDGTPRIVQLTSSIVLAHSGVSADGRAVMAAVQRLAIEYQYTFDEEIPIENLLEELSMLFQDYTVKPGYRPFGCSILVATPESRYKMEPSGSVSRVEDPICMIGSSMTKDISKEIYSDFEEAKTKLKLAFLKDFRGDNSLNLSLICAFVAKDGTFSVENEQI